MYVSEMSYKQQEQWLIQKGSELKQAENDEDNAILRQARILYEVWSVWSVDHSSDGSSLSNEATWSWGYDFYSWAKSFTKRRAGREPANITIDNKISIYRDYIALEIIEAPEKVFIPKRDTFGKLIDPSLEDENAWEEIEPNFSNCDYGKLLVARGTARTGQMSPDAWSALLDPYASVNTLKEALGQLKKEIGDDNSDDFYIIEQDGIIFGCSQGKRVPVFQVLFENDNGDDLFRRTLSHVLKAVGIHVPLIYQSK